ncbi:hypothetical protein Tco_0471911 [Tanacetum coccineum]
MTTEEIQGYPKDPNTYAQENAGLSRSHKIAKPLQRKRLQDNWSKNFQRNKRPLKRFVLEESITEPVITKEEEIEKSIKKRGKIRKQKARKGIHIDKTAHDESEEEREAFMKDKVTSASSESEIGIYAIPTATKPPSIVD